MENMLDWLKEILGDNYSEEIDKKVSAKIGENFVSRTGCKQKPPRFLKITSVA